MIALLALMVACAGCCPDLEPQHALKFAHGVWAHGPKCEGPYYRNVYFESNSTTCVLLPDGQLVPLSEITIEWLRTLASDPDVLKAKASVCTWKYDPQNWAVYGPAYTVPNAGPINSDAHFYGYEIQFENGHVKWLRAWYHRSPAGPHAGYWFPALAQSPTSTPHLLPISTEDLTDVFGPVVSQVDDHWF